MDTLVILQHFVVFNTLIFTMIVVHGVNLSFLPRQTTLAAPQPVPPSVRFNQLQLTTDETTESDIYLGTSQINQSDVMRVYISALMPDDDSYLFSMSQLVAAFEIAKGTITPYFTNRRVSFIANYADTKCSDKHAMNEAFSLYQKFSAIHLIFGPMCDKPADPVAKQAFFWNIPMVTVGALDDIFTIRRKQDYPLLIRAGPITLNNLSYFFYVLMKRFNWNKIKIFHMTYDTIDLYEHFSYYLGLRLHENLFYKYEMNARKYHLDTIDKEFKTLFMEELGEDFAGYTPFQMGIFVGYLLTLITNIALCGKTVQFVSTTAEVNVSLLLPVNGSYMFSVSKISPAIDVGIQHVYDRYILGSFTRFNLTFADSMCRESICMNEAINLYLRHRPHVFIGPTCDLAVAPVVRQASFWNIPVISVGALARDFRIHRKESYSLLTRLSPANLNTLSYFLRHLFKMAGFQKVKMLYSKEETKGVFDLFCYYLTEFIVHAIQDQASDVTLTFYSMEDQVNITNILTTQISLEYGGKSI